MLPTMFSQGAIFFVEMQMANAWADGGRILACRMGGRAGLRMDVAGRFQWMDKRMATGRFSMEGPMDADGQHKLSKIKRRMALMAGRGGGDGWWQVDGLSEWGDVQTILAQMRWQSFLFASWRYYHHLVRA